MPFHTVAFNNYCFSVDLSWFNTLNTDKMLNMNLNKCKKNFKQLYSTTVTTLMWLFVNLSSMPKTLKK